MLTRVTCTFVFTLFTFYYLYCYQADLLTVIQHVLSKGQTHYNHFVGAVLITVLALLLQVGVVKIFQKMRLAWALTFVPSALCIMMLTNVEVSSADYQLVFGAWRYASPVLIVLFVAAVWGINKSGVLASLPRLLFGAMRELWANLLIVLLLMLSICFAGNNDKYYHVRIHAEQCLIDNDFAGALDAIRKYDVADGNLSMLTVFALSKSNELGEHLFEFPILGVDEMLPNGKDIKFAIYPAYKLYTYLGGRYIQSMASRQFINFQRRTHHVNKPMADYILCAHLLDRDLNAFVKDLPKYYEVNDSVPLPRHYSEALTLYMHTHTNPSIVYNNNVYTTDYEDYQALERKFANKRERKNMLHRTYGNTYWYYFDYRK